MRPVSDYVKLINSVRRTEYIVLTDGRDPAVRDADLKGLQEIVRWASSKLLMLGAVDKAWEAENGWRVITVGNITEADYHQWRGHHSAESQQPTITYPLDVV